MQDAHNLCWKLAAVLDGVASDALLDTYEPERRSAVQRNVDRSVENATEPLGDWGRPSACSTRDSPPTKGWARVGRLWSGRPEDEEFRRRIDRMFASQSMEFREHNVEYGYTYDSTAVVDDGSPPPEPVDPIRVYEPSTRPGSPLPHAWLDADAGERRSRPWTLCARDGSCSSPARTGTLVRGGRSTRSRWWDPPRRRPHRPPRG